MEHQFDQAPLLLVVTGPPGSGKTTVARPLARRLGLPLIAKDHLKEVLFDVLGWDDPAYSRRLSDAAYEIMFHLIGGQLQCGRSLAVEANFRPELARRLSPAGGPERRLLQVRCFAAPEVLIGRLEHRADSGSRHPGHCDEQLRDRIPAWAASGEVLDLPCPLIEIDTGSPDPIDLAELARRVVRAAAGGSR